MPPKTALIIGSTRGIGLELTRQLLSEGYKVIATSRSPTTAPNPHPPPQSTPRATGNASQLWALTGTENGHNLTVLECDVADEGSIVRLREEVRKLGRKGGVLGGGVLDLMVLVAGVLEYPGRISETSFSLFTHHLQTNTIGPLICAQQILSLSSASVLTPISNTSTSTSSPPIHPIHTHTLIFLSSDSGSTTNFRSFEDGFGVYSASKAALNQGLRHLSAELQKKYRQTLNLYRQRLLPQPQSPSNSRFNTISTAPPSTQFEGIIDGTSPSEPHKPPIILAVHPGEVSTDMASNASVDWDVEGIIGAEESVRGMLRVFEEKGWGGVDEGGRGSAVAEGRREEEEGAATFWTWEGRRYPW